MGCVNEGDEDCGESVAAEVMRGEAGQRQGRCEVRCGDVTCINTLVIFVSLPQPVTASASASTSCPYSHSTIK